ncbi:Zinc finger protein 37 [Holothuria leucospilota]|uniref:Zinc finger protein 37 n=1 Tax=Holothuria leucospilota TaxID=206669 RepID=A0A9Q1C6X6_HOLLE|nr:Zinc finger protein 37 [Holothuria leucospilota]
MGELYIHVKVLKSSPILFTWLNKETGSVEGCLVTCPCQKLGLTESSDTSLKSGKKSATLDQNLLGQALKKATIVSTPRETDSGSVLLPERKTRGGAASCGNVEKGTQNQLCSKGNGKIKFTTCTNVSESNQPSKILTIRLADEIIETSPDDFNHKDDNESSLKEDVNFQTDINDAYILTENTNETKLGLSKGGVTDEGCLKNVIPPSVKTASGQITENSNIGTKDNFVKEVETENRVYGCDKSDGCNLKREKGFETHGQLRCKEDNCKQSKTADTCKTSASGIQPHQDEHTLSSRDKQDSDKKETSGNTILTLVESQNKGVIVSNSISDTSDVNDTIVQIEIGSSLSNPSYIGKDGRDSMSEAERTLYDALKSIIDPCTTDLNRHSDDMSTASNILVCASSGVEADHNTEPSEPKGDSLSRGKMSKAMLKYRQYEKEKFLKKLHKLGEKKNDHAVICEVCGALLSKKRLKSHMEALHSSKERERNFECSTCHKKFLKAINLERHKLSHTDYMSKCRFCEKSFKYDYYRKAHEKYHMANPPPAPVRKPRQQNSMLQNDLPMAGDSKRMLGRSTQNGTVSECHETLRIFTCNICGKSVRLAGKYQHLKIHKEKRYKCDICDFRLGTNAALKMHMKKHTQECNIPCRHCGKLFKRYQERLTHERIHTREKPFICDICDKRWRDRGTYLGHMKKHHPGMALDVFTTTN